ncbi:MAG TPA: ATP-binding protein, partial [Arenimonas sp.]|nr:ATP-binding protein [Arenimonas sp.]
QVQAEAGAVRLQYRDDGVGMSDEVAARAFEPFFTTRRGSGGSGLGLHLVYNLTTQVLGGQITLHSKAGEGCEFRLRIPLHAPLQGTQGEAAAAPPTAGMRRRRSDYH